MKDEVAAGDLVVGALFQQRLLQMRLWQ